MIRNALVAVPLLLSTVASAIDNDQYYKVDHVYSWTDGKIQVWLEDAGAHSCSDQTYSDRYLMGDTTIGFDEKVSLLIAAKVSGQPVKLRYTCINGLPYVDAVRF